MYTPSDRKTDGEIPEFCKSRTALYASCITKTPCPMIRAWHHISARISAAALLLRGYDTLIVDYGTTFGKIALQELISLRKYRNYTLVAVKIIGERNHYSNRFEEIKDLSACDVCLGLIGKSDFLSTVVMHSNMIVNGNQIYSPKNHGIRQLINYLKNLN